MSEFLNLFNSTAAAINGVLWHTAVLYVLMGLGILFTIWSGFCQYRSLTHGGALIMGKYDHEEGTGAINHFQALSAALSATVGVGNIGGVALGIALGGPGAVFWMWVVGFLGMALKMMEVTQSMIYRNTDDPQNPHGGPMWVVRRGFAQWGKQWEKPGKLLGGFFCVTLLLSTFTGGLFFQAWNASAVATQSFGVAPIVVGIVLAVIVGMVILGGISRIGSVAGKIVPFMCGLYLIAAIYVVLSEFHRLPELFGLIFQGAFDTLGGTGAFIGGTAGWAFSAGLQRAFFSNEAGQGSSSIAHSAARTSEPAREGLVAGLEPFIDTLVVCTLTALVILSSGSWNRDIDTPFLTQPEFVDVSPGVWQATDSEIPFGQGTWRDGENVFVKIQAYENINTGNQLHILPGVVEVRDGRNWVQWQPFNSEVKPAVTDEGFYKNLSGAALTAYSFDRFHSGLGRWLVTIATWLFAISTMISWCYYGEQGVVYLVGSKGVLPYKLTFCVAIILSSAGLVRSTTELNNISLLGAGAMLFVNIPIMLLFSRDAIAEQKRYWQRMTGKQDWDKVAA